MEGTTIKSADGLPLSISGIGDRGEEAESYLKCSMNSRECMGERGKNLRARTDPIDTIPAFGRSNQIPMAKAEELKFHSEVQQPRLPTMFSVVALSMIIGGLGTPTPPPGPTSSAELIKCSSRSLGSKIGPEARANLLIFLPKLRPARDNSGNLINHDATCPTGTTHGPA